MDDNLGPCQSTLSIYLEQFRDEPTRVKVKPVQRLWKQCYLSLEDSKPLMLWMTGLPMKEPCVRTKVNQGQTQNLQIVDRKSRSPAGAGPFRDEPGSPLFAKPVQGELFDLKFKNNRSRQFQTTPSSE